VTADLLELHASVHAAPTDRSVTGTAALQQPLSITFDEAALALQRLPDLFFEPDGWFVWEAACDGRRWQISGQLYDRGSTLDHIELKLAGHVPIASFDAVLAAFGWPAQALIFQLPSTAATYDERAFRQLLRALRP
jgi:hypothetical protein